MCFPIIQAEVLTPQKALTVFLDTFTSPISPSAGRNFYLAHNFYISQRHKANSSYNNSKTFNTQPRQHESKTYISYYPVELRDIYQNSIKTDYNTISYSFVWNSSQNFHFLD